MNTTKSDLLNALFQKYDLVFNPDDPKSRDNDVFIHPHYKIITRQGIQKIERGAGIKCNINIHNSGPDYCNVSGTGTTASGETYTTLASANSANSTNKYYCEMAEKRCRSRLILTLVGLYEQGFFGEDEFDRDEDDTTPKSRYKGR